MNVKLTVDRDMAIKWFSRLDFKDATYIDGLYLVQMHKTSLIYDKPIYVGCCILEISKVRMMDLHYNTIHKHFENNYDLIYSDTDSLVFHIKHNKLYKWMSEHPDEFDLSNMNKYKRYVIYNTLGKMKSEVGENIVT